MDMSNIGKVEDRISGLPDSIIHHILSYLDIKPVAQTALLSKRWKYLWTSFPTLVFPYWCHYSLSATNTFTEFVETTLLLHDTSSNIQKFHLQTNEHMSASRVHSWIKYLTMRNLEELNLWLDHDKEFFVPLSLFTCESLIKLDIHANDATHIPRSFCFPKLKSLKLSGIRFTDDCSWNDQQFSKCPVLEHLVLEDCTWFGMRNFCISTPALKFLKISTWEADGLQHCALKIDAPNLVSLAYFGRVAKEYDLSSFQTVESAEILFCTHEISIEQNIGNVAEASKFIRALSRVRCLEMYAETLEALSFVNDVANILPVFPVLKDLVVKSLFSLFKAIPNLRYLVFEKSCVDNNKDEEHSWDDHLLTAGCMFQQLRSVTFVRSIGNSRQMRWVKRTQKL